MRQFIFCRTKPGRVQSKTGNGACNVVARRDANVPCPELPDSVGSQLRHFVRSAECSSACRILRADLPRLADSFVGDSVLRSGAHCLDRCDVESRRFSVLSGHAVTLALHACNAKKNFATSVPPQSSILPIFACNARQSPPIFSKNASVIFAVDSSIDRMMPNRNHTTDFPYGPIFAGLARATSRVLSVLPLHATERGAP